MNEENKRKTEENEEKVGDHLCADCGKSFKAKTSLRRHYLNVHKFVRYQCEICLKLFTTNNQKKKHAAKHVQVSI